MIQTDVIIPENIDVEVLHFGPDQLPYMCIRESLERRVDSTISWHWHQNFEVAFVAEGALECRTPDQRIRLEKGEAVFINTGVLHMYKKLSQSPCVIYAHAFDSMFLCGALSSGIFQKYIYPITNNHAIQLQAIRPENHHQVLMLDAVQAMIELARDERFGYEFQLQAQMSQFWCRLLTLIDLRTGETGRADNDIVRIKAMLHYIHENYARQITLKDIADAAAVSERECSRCFQRCFRESAITYLNKHRIRVAADLLLKEPDSILSISRRCGFHSSGYFGRVFFQMLGCTPKEYRKKVTGLWEDVHESCGILFEDQ